MNVVHFAVVLCAVMLTLVTSPCSAHRRNYFHGYGGPTTYYGSKGNAHYSYGHGHVTYQPSYRRGGKKGGRRNKGGKRGGRTIVIIHKSSYGHGSSYGGYGHDYGGYDSFGESYGYYH
ncbi:glycine-rich protein-like [Pollicipes pollicipes]|uniref:glycine-rich protein-like n=1 Tax=Pollicipes pollicipes TaxID=41117 RepID=UPI00188550C9|nr:glycine-rich protein-like [Pollicipes pollicipes]